ncbi:hypothetical protein PoB_007090600 [Plakobranchus ocellatus]|uniref:Uncharacterized protein n=1 Tax=Plakobranchus ocellatus TaxID=259542 RepID=A0AAV4DKJ5_9GAST|nr:hypothetical protein PoB_007090600 [Plakobranchus ocellatus]
MSTRNNNFSNRDQKGQEGDGYASYFYLVPPEDLVEVDQPGKTFTFEMRVSDYGKVEVHHSTLDFTDSSRTNADIRGGMVRVQAQRGGIFVARSHNKLP